MAAPAAEIGPAATAVIEELLAENALFGLRAAQGVLGLADQHNPARLEAACAKATAAGDPRSSDFADPVVGCHLRQIHTGAGPAARGRAQTGTLEI